MEMIIGYAIAIMAIVLIGKLISFPVKLIFKLVVNGVIGAVVLTILNFFGGAIGISVGINIFSALVAGFFGIPGVIVLILINLL